MKLFEDSTEVYEETTVEPGLGKIPVYRVVYQTKYYCIKDCVEHMYNTLEKLIDYKTDLEQCDGV